MLQLPDPNVWDADWASADEWVGPTLVLFPTLAASSLASVGGNALLSIELRVAVEALRLSTNIN